MSVLMGTPSGVGLEHKAIYVFINCNKYIWSSGDNAERKEYNDAQSCCFSPAVNPKYLAERAVWGESEMSQRMAASKVLFLALSTTAHHHPTVKILSWKENEWVLNLNRQKGKKKNKSQIEKIKTGVSLGKKKKESPQLFLWISPCLY